MSMAQPSRLVAALAAAAAVAGACAGVGQDGGNAQRPAAPVGPFAGSGVDPEPIAPLQAGQPLPQAKLSLLRGQDHFRTEDLRGRPAVLNFWATWCAFCVEEMPDLQAVHEQFADRVQFVGIDREDDLDKARTLADETGVTYPLAVDADGSFFRAVKARAMPTTVLVDAGGTIVYRHAGPLTAADLRGLIQRKLHVSAEAS